MGHYYTGNWPTASNSGQRTIGDVLESERRLSAAVTAVREWVAEEAYDDPDGDPYCLGYNDACRDILAALDGA